MRENFDEDLRHSGVYATELFTQKAIDLIKRHDVKEKPLFMILSQLAPHSGNEDNPLQAPEDAKEKFNYIQNETLRTYAGKYANFSKTFRHDLLDHFSNDVSFG